MTKQKQTFLFIAIITLGIGLFMLISQKSRHNPDFDNKSTWSDHSKKLKDLEEKMKNLSEEIKQQMGKGSCKFDGDCQVVGLGVKTCDGYMNFLVYSPRDTDEPELLRLVRDFNQTNQQFNELSLTVPCCVS